MSKTVLIVDDERDVVVYMSTLLQQSGYAVLSAATASEGLELARENSPDLVCLDIMMPGELGISVYNALRRDRKLASIPVLIISGVAQEKEFDFREYVPDRSIPSPEGYMEKPINVDRFLQLVKKLSGSGRPNERPEAARDG
jgi:CheY-like chemotaxis protein